jgi:hypothetical protein
VALLSASLLAHAQDDPAQPARASRTAAAAEVVREQEPVHFRDKDGALVPVLGYTLTDFDNFIDLKNQIGRGQMRPRYTLQRIMASGTAGEKFAELRIDYEVLVTADGWVRVPLRLGEGILLEKSTYRGPTRHFLEFEGPLPGYAAWFLGNGEAVHHLSLRVLAPLETVAGKQRLRITSPRSTQSELRLTVPVAHAEATVSGGAVLENPLAAAGSNRAASELVLRALDGELNVAWWPPSRASQEATPDLEAVGAVLVHVTGRTFRSDATFTVRSAGGEYRFDRFRVKLPPGAQIIPLEQPGVRITAPAAGSKQSIAEVQLDEPTVGPVDVQLLTERSPNGKRDELLELAGFEVLDTVRQWGHIGVRVEEEWQVAWGERHPGVRRVEKESLPDSLKYDNLVAGFEYAGQGCSLLARILQRQTRVAVEPEYEVRIEPTRMVLSARLKYRVPGAKVFGVEVDLRGWETDGDRVGPATLVDQDQVSPQLVTPLAIPLRQPTKGDFEITIEAWRTLPPDARQIEFHLPHPVANNLVLAPVVVLPADNVALTPNADALVGLKPQPLPRKYGLANRQQEPLFFLGDVVQGMFAGEMTILPRAVSVQTAANIVLEEREAKIEQRLAYRVLHEPLDRVLLEAPRALAESGQIEVSLGGRPLPVVRSAEDAAEEAGAVTLRALLTDEQGKMSERSGSFELVARYSVPREKLLPDVSSSLDVPLLMPLDGTLAGNQATVQSLAGVKVVPREGPWTPLDVAGQRLEQSAALRLTTSERAGVLPLALHLEAASAAASTIVQRCWIQTQLSASQRQDRAVYRFTSNEPTIEIGLPKQVVFKDVSVLLNGQPASYKTLPDRRIAIALSKENLPRSQLLELNYRFPARQGRLGRQSLAAPLLDPDVWVQRTYWQVVAPPQEHVIGAPAGFIGEFVWDWNGWFFGRRPTLGQAQLEQWCGAPTIQRADLPSGANIYLFSALGSAAELPLWTAGRTSLVFGASLVVLLAGMLLIYAPRLRRPLALTLVIGVTAVGMIYPEPVLVLLQAGSLGLALGILALLLERAIAPRRPRAAATRRASSSIIDRALIHAPVQPMAVNSPSSTRTAAIAAPIASPEHAP